MFIRFSKTVYEYSPTGRRNVEGTKKDGKSDTHKPGTNSDVLGPVLEDD